MADSQADRVKQAISIIELARALGLEVKGKQARCFNGAGHKNNDKHFSLGFNLKTNRFKCFVCNVSGSVIDLVMQVKGLGTRAAIKDLAEMTGESAAEGLKKGFKRPLEASKRADIDTGAIGGVYKALQGFCQGLDSEAFNYLTGPERGLTRETIERFNLFSIKDYKAADSHLKNTFSLELLKQAGILSEKNNLIFYKHRLVIPFLKDGETFYLQGRLIGSGEGKYKQLAGLPVPLFNLDTLKGLQPGERVYICEGAFDAMMLEQEGFKAIAILGVNNFKPESAVLLKGFEVMLALDNDKSGQTATEAIAKVFLRQGQPVKVKALPEGVKDITEFFIR
jgi:DNA primase